jgi:transcriptional regulator with XRE-family HTH domain
MAEKIVHQGKNVKRFREMLGMKQDALALAMGDDWNQQKISLLEQREVIDPSILEQVAKVLKINPEAIKNLGEESAINIFSNTFSDFKDNASASAMNYQCTFNPLDKVLELYERMLKEKDALIEKLLNERNKK